MKKNKISIITLGCKVNQYESNAIAKELEDNNFDVIHDISENSNAYIINTCAVTNEGEKKSRGMIAEIKKVSPNAPIYICGCSSQNDPSKFEKYPGVRAIYGTSSKQDLAKIIIKDFKNDFKNNIIQQSNIISTTYQDEYTSKGDRTRVVMKIQEGCNNFCSYCLIPYLRGRERSRTIESIKNELDIQGITAKEVVFTGINLSHYGLDLKEKATLKDIAILMRNYKHIRFRFSSLEQDIITEDFLNILKETPNFAPHFHLSLQSGCDRTLKFMNRKYLSNEYYNKVELIRKTFKNPAITTDIIVGFPTETEEDFINSYNFAKKCRFAKMHIFPYSVRSGTVASKMKNIATNVKERVEKLSNLDKLMQEEYITNLIGNEYEIIIETLDNNYYTGHTENFIKCYIENKSNLKQNEIYKVKIISFFKDGAIAEIIN